MKALKNGTSKVFNIIKFITKIIFKYKYLIYMILPLLSMDIITRLFGYNIDFYDITGISPNLFTISWIILFIGLSLNLKKKIGKKIYLFINIFFLVIFLLNNIYYSMTNTFFDFNLLESTSEGAPYILDTIKNAKPIIYLSAIFIIYLIHKGYKSIPYKTKTNHLFLLTSIITFIIIHSFIPLTLGKANEELTWNSWKNPRNIYMSFNDSNKSLKISGIYEYTFRNFYVTYLKTDEEENEEDELFLENAFSNYGEYKNKYTSKFLGKNLILIQLEGIDNWLIDKETTPTLYKMMKNSYNFTNHYSYYNGGGSTFNSEFAVNTGFITPLSYTQNAYTFNKNSFPYSMANLFKNYGYVINAFHMNTGEYYSRTANYQNWGYDNYYGLQDINEYKNKDKSYTLDRNLIQDEQFNQLLFPNDTNFIDYIITYSGHMPFNNTTAGVCKLLYAEDTIKNLGLIDKYNEGLIKISHKKDITSNNTLLILTESFIDKQEDIKHEIIIEEMTEEECVKRQAKETDYMMELLLQNLEDRNLIDNTVIAVFADHYVYTLEDKTILDKYKETDNNLINKTPFFIWSKDLKQQNIKEVTSQLNILPTILNLFGIKEYNPNNYIGKDALDPNYDGIVFFSDYSWYDGNVYVENAEVTNNKKISYDKLEEKNYYINYITKKNDLALKFNYFKQK